MTGTSDSGGWRPERTVNHAVANGSTARGKTTTASREPLTASRLPLTASRLPLTAYR